MGNNDYISDIRGIVADILEDEVDVVGIDSHLVKELGIDSMSVLEFMAALEKNYSVVIKPEYFPELITVRKAADLVGKLLAADA